MSLIPFLLTSTTITPGAGDVAAGAGDAAASGGNMFGAFASSNPVLLIIGYCVLLFVVMYFFSIKPNQKREKQMAEMRKAIAIGDTVVTNSGLYGKVVDITYECFLIEFGTNKSVCVPVNKGEVFAKREPNLSNDAPPEAEKPQKKGLFSRG